MRSVQGDGALRAYTPGMSSHNHARSAVSPALSRDYLLHHRLCPRDLSREGFVRVAAAPDALLSDALDDLRLVYGREVEIEAASLEEVQRLIERQTVGHSKDLEHTGA